MPPKRRAVSGSPSSAAPTGRAASSDAEAVEKVLECQLDDALFPIPTDDGNSRGGPATNPADAIIAGGGILADKLAAEMRLLQTGIVDQLSDLQGAISTLVEARRSDLIEEHFSTLKTAEGDFEDVFSSWSDSAADIIQSLEQGQAELCGFADAIFQSIDRRRADFFVSQRQRELAAEERVIQMILAAQQALLADDLPEPLAQPMFEACLSAARALSTTSQADQKSLQRTAASMSQTAASRSRARTATSSVGRGTPSNPSSAKKRPRSASSRDYHQHDAGTPGDIPPPQHSDCRTLPPSLRCAIPSYSSMADIADTQSATSFAARSQSRASGGVLRPQSHATSPADDLKDRLHSIPSHMSSLASAHSRSLSRAATGGPRFHTNGDDTSASAPLFDSPEGGGYPPPRSTPQNARGVTNTTMEDQPAIKGRSIPMTLNIHAESPAAKSVVRGRGPRSNSHQSNMPEGALDNGAEISLMDDEELVLAQTEAEVPQIDQLLSSTTTAADKKKGTRTSGSHEWMDPSVGLRAALAHNWPTAGRSSHAATTITTHGSQATAARKPQLDDDALLLSSGSAALGQAPMDIDELLDLTPDITRLGASKGGSLKKTANRRKR